MKSLIFLITVLLANFYCFGQAKIKVEFEGVTINNTSDDIINNSAVLDIHSSDKGVLFPSFTTDQRDLINAPAPGLFIYNTTVNNYEFWNGTAWMGMAIVPGDVDPGTGGTPPDPTIIANGYEGVLASGVATAFVNTNSEWVDVPETTLSGNVTVV